jgi:hypothetical protein
MKIVQLQRVFGPYRMMFKGVKGWGGRSGSHYNVSAKKRKTLEIKLFWRVQ